MWCPSGKHLRPASISYILRLLKALMLQFTLFADDTCNSYSSKPNPNTENILNDELNKV